MLPRDNQIEVVLVRPRNPLNIGAAARAMANFGLSHLSVVAPWEAHWREARSAVGAPELLLHAKEFASVSEAVFNSNLVIGTGSLTHRKPAQPVVSLPQLAPIVRRELEQGAYMALVFGSEKHGLTRDDLSYCHMLVEIPTDEAQPSMNLGQAVAVCLYELATRAFSEDETATPGHDNPLLHAPLGDEPGPAAHSGTLDLLAGIVEEIMLAAGYSPRTLQAANTHELRVLLRRLAHNERDTRRILGLFRRILWRMSHPPKEQ